MREIFCVKNHKKVRKIKPRHSQNGMATILIVLLVGASMTAIAVGLARSVKSTQGQHIAVHAATQSQAAAWAAVNVFKEYLKSLSYEDVEGLTAGSTIALEISNVQQDLSATVVEVDTSAKDTDGIRVKTNIRARDAMAQSTSAIQVIYLIANTQCSICQLLNAKIDLFDDTNLGGDITLNAPAGTETTVNIEGDINALNIALTGINNLNVTGDVTLGSAVPIEQVYTNGNLLLDGSANVGKASVVGETTLKNNGRADILYSNGDVAMGGGATIAVNTRGNVDITMWAMHDTVIAKGDVNVAAPIQKVHAKGDITLTQWADARDIQTESELNCVSAYWSAYDYLASGGNMNNCPGASAKVEPNSSVSVSVMEELKPFTMERPTIDAWAVRNQANYIFEYDAGDIRVTVTNVNSIADGTYYLGSYPAEGGRGHLQYLCDAVDGAGNCTSPSARTHTLCQGYTTYNACFSYDKSTKTWTVEGKNMAPGVVWFEGNLNLSNGTYYNTFFVTGDITTAGAMKTYGVNYIGYDAICDNDFPLNKTADFLDLYPTNLCNKIAGELVYSALGNVVLLAGGNDPDRGGVYRGGNITLGASNELFGTVLAGNYFDTMGDTTVHGYVSAAANRSVGSGANDLGGKTVIDLTNLPPGYRPNEVPLFDNAGTCSSSCATASAKAEILWSRYL